MRYANVAHLVERHLAKVEVASSSLVVRSKWRHSQVVRQGSAKASFPRSHLGDASRKTRMLSIRVFVFCKDW